MCLVTMAHIYVHHVQYVLLFLAHIYHQSVVNSNPFQILRNHALT